MISTTSNDKHCRHVGFSDINVREFDLTLAHHPTKGAVLSLGWQYTDQPTESLSDYEESHTKRRSFSELKLTKPAIKQRLKDHGFCEAYIDRRLRRAKAISIKPVRTKLKRSKSWEL